MKVLLSVLLIAFVARASAQTRSLRCFECADCPSVNITNHPIRPCYGPSGTEPTIQTNPVTVSLTASQTTTQPPPNVIQSNPQYVDIQDYASAARQVPQFTCYTAQIHIGDRFITNRGCALIHQNDQLTCQNLNQGEDPRFCQLCNSDDCNTVFTAGVMKTLASFSLIFAAVLIALRLN